MRIVGLLLAAGVWAMPATTVAQETRVESIAAEQAEKATHLAPYEPNRVERFVMGLRLGEQPPGVYPYLDSVYNGGGFTLGAGYRYYTGDRTHLSVAGLYSIKGYKLIQATITSPGHVAGHLDLRGQVLWRDATQVNYYGLGIDSAQEARTNFRMQQAVVGAELEPYERRTGVLGCPRAGELRAGLPGCDQRERD